MIAPTINGSLDPLSSSRKASVPCMGLAFRLPLARDLDQHVGQSVGVSPDHLDFVIGQFFSFACEQMAAEVERNRIVLRLTRLRLFHNDAHNNRVES